MVILSANNDSDAYHIIKGLYHENNNGRQNKQGKPVNYVDAIVPKASIS